MELKSAKEKYSKYLTTRNVLIVLGIVIVFVGGIIGLDYLREQQPDTLVNDQYRDEIVAKLNANRNTLDQDGFNQLINTTNIEQLQFLLDNGGHFLPSVVLFKIGDETYTTDDFNEYFFTNYQYTYYPQQQPPDDVKLYEAVDSIVQDSVTMHGLKKNYPEIEAAFFTDTTRAPGDYASRGNIYDNIKDQFNAEHITSVKGERITIWHRNIFMPPMGPDEAYRITKEKMDDLREQLIAGDINMIEAGDIIKSDTELAEIDYAYESNAYRVFNSEDGFAVFNDPDINRTLFTLEEGEYSEVLVGTDTNGVEVYPAYFTVILVSEKSGDGVTLQNLYEKNRSVYLVEVL